MSTVSISPVLVEVMRHNLLSTAEEMWESLRQSAFSLNIRERGDCATAIFDALGELIVLPDAGPPLHLSSMDGLVRELLIKQPNFRPGDMFITNDPYGGGGSHLPDFSIVAPVFHEDELVCFVANVGHHTDVGGSYPGSQAIDNREIYQEGLIMPIVKVCDREAPMEDIVSIIARNSRSEMDRRGDILAQIGANQVGVRRVKELCQRYTVGVVRAYLNAMIQYTAARLRLRLRQLSDGAWDAVDHVDGDGLGGGPLPIIVRLEKQGEELRFDFAGTADQVQSARNVPFIALKATVLTVVRTLLDPGIHPSGGFDDVVHISCPTGCLLNPLPPAAVGERGDTLQAVGDVVADVIGKMVPDAVVGGLGAYQRWCLSGCDPETGRGFVSYETIAGGHGATPFHDGADAVRGWQAGSMNPPIEALEQELPVRVIRYQFARSSGGPGKYRGGLGLVRDIQILADGVRLTTGSMRQVVPPPGRCGGNAGKPGAFILNPGTSAEEVLAPAATDRLLSRGEILRIVSPGGGGYRPLAERARDAVLKDLREGKISAQD